MTGDFGSGYPEKTRYACLQVVEVTTPRIRFVCLFK